jgi:hypothetical protein
MSRISFSFSFSFSFLLAFSLATVSHTLEIWWIFQDRKEKINTQFDCVVASAFEATTANIVPLKMQFNFNRFYLISCFWT